MIQASSDSYVIPDDTTAYTVGLLHPIGKMLVNHYHETYGIQRLDADYPLNEDAEKMHLGFNRRKQRQNFLLTGIFKKKS